MADEKKTAPRCCVVICGDEAGKDAAVLRCDSAEAKELLAKFRECCDDTECCG